MVKAPLNEMSVDYLKTHDPAPVFARAIRARGIDIDASVLDSLTTLWLLGRSGTADIADATVVTAAIAMQAQIVTSDRDDVSRLADAAGARLVIIEA